MEAVTDFIFLGSKITADSDCSHEIKRRLLLGRKAMTNLDSILKRRDITLLTKAGLVGLQRKLSTIELMFLNCGAGENSWCIFKIKSAPWTGRRSNRFILKEINPEYSLEGLMQNLKLQYFGHLMQKADSLEKTLMLGKIEDRKRRGRQRIS